MDTTARTDDEPAGLDIAALLRYGLTAARGPLRTSLFGDGAVGGVAHALTLPEPLRR
ncbi:hypothetical protein ACIG0D_09280 [Streptomyces sp. NPDC052773]|uniref:hypothetical protein n=1 Tax=Streptomyces sp. NPDC052773 TaxID=3365693 RepID=UPI0037D1D784